VIARIGATFRRLSGRFVPDPFVLAIGLTAIVMLVSMRRLAYLEPSCVGADCEGPIWTVLSAWVEGFSSRGGLAFALQMSLVLVTGHALALSPPVQRFVDVISRVPKSAGGAAALVALVACIAGVVHWGLGAIVGALLAREIGRSCAERGVAVHYPVLGAAAYSGLAVWHGGLSGSAPLMAAQDGNFLEPTIGVLPLSETIWGMSNLVITGGLIVLIPVAYRFLVPADESTFERPDASQLATVRLEDRADSFSVARRLPAPLIGAGALVLVIVGIVTDRWSFDLNTMILVFLFAGLALQGSFERYVAAITDGARGAGAIVLQFPFYFAMLEMMKASQLIDAVSASLVSLSTAGTFPVVAFLLAGLVNFFVPSGGGQWAVQAEILLGAGQQLGVAPEATIMAFAYGDAWTNMLQPFWALPLLGIMRLQARDIIGYTAIIFGVMGIWIILMLLVMGQILT